MDHSDILETPSPSVPFVNAPHRLEAFREALLKRTPWTVVTVLLILVNAAIFGWMVYRGLPWLTPDPAKMIEWGANYGPLTLAGQEWRLFASMFLHFGAVHLGMNMLALWNVGRFVERLFGNVGFLLLYLISGLAGSFGSVMFHPEVVSAGASGAIFGVAGGLIGGVWKLRRSLPPALLAAARWITINVLVLLVVFGVVNHFHQMIDNAAHIAGFLTGLVIGLILAEPIPHPVRSRPWLRNGIVAGLGIAAGSFAWMMLPSPPADAAALETQYHRVEKQVLRILESAEGQLRAKAIDQEEYAKILEKEVLPRWKKLHQDFQTAGPVPEVHREWMADLLKILSLRETGWQLQIEAIHEIDPAKEREAEKLLQDASDIIQKMNDQAQ